MKDAGLAHHKTGTHEHNHAEDRQDGRREDATECPELIGGRDGLFFFGVIRGVHCPRLAELRRHLTNLRDFFKPFLSLLSP